MEALLEKLSKIGIIPVIRIDDAEKAVPLARALLEGGIPCAEVTFRTPQAAEALKRIAQEVPQILLGAGTVLSPEQADQAIAAGASFIVSPGFNPRVVRHCLDRGIPITPGCSTPSDIEQALELGLEAVKLFPAEPLGGLEYIKALAGPYTTMKFIPTGGINAQNLVNYIKFDKVLACGGSWMVNPELINAGNFEKIKTLCQEAMLNMLGLKVVHLDITEAAKEGNQGTRGYITLGTNSPFRARAYFERMGLEFKEEFNGFTVRLIQNP